MSVTEEMQKLEDSYLIREFTAVGLAVEGRTVDVRLVPFGEVARVSDDGVNFYSEEWMPGAFDHQLKAANRIHAKYGHSRSVMDVVGHGIELRREPDGYHVSTKIHNTVQGETVLELLRDGALPAVSLEAQPTRKGAVRTAAGVVQRVKANLTGFAFCRQGAYQGAQVLAIREQVIDPIDPELQLPDIDTELVERCQRLGISLPQRFQAQPAEDTSAETDTPETAPASDGNHDYIGGLTDA